MRHFCILSASRPFLKAVVQNIAKSIFGLAWAASGRGEQLLLTGALTDPLDKGVFLFQAESATTGEKYVLSDPYVDNGVVASWHVREWVTTIGTDATTPVHKP